MMKPSEYLKSKGWTPLNSNVPPRQTKWRKGTLEMEFIQALIHQENQDKESETK